MPIKQVVIVGNGFAAWMTASALARALKETVTMIRVLPATDHAPDADDSLGVTVNAESSLPAMLQFHRLVGFDENELVRNTRAGFSLGTAISNWSQQGVIFNPFGEVGAPLGPVNFLHVMLRLRDEGQQPKLANFSLAALCAQAGRFSRPVMNDHSIWSTLEYGLQLELGAYTEWLKKDAVTHGVVQESSRFQQAALHQSGTVTHLVSEDGRRFSGDLFIDCSGPSRTLASQVHAEKFVSWSHWMPCDQVTSSITPASEVPQPYVLLSAKDHGWLRTIDLPGRRYEQSYSSSAHGHNMSNENSSSESITYNIGAGYHPLPWQKNCIALGGAASVIDPVSSLQLHLFLAGVERLIALFPNAAECIQESVEFNRQSSAELECARDYAIAHYKLNGRGGEPFWDACRTMPVPDSLNHRIEVYKSTGRVVMHDGEVIDRMNWVALFDAQNVRPAAYDVVARGIPLQLMNEHLNSIRQTLLAAVATMPFYPAYLGQIFSQ
ncbi:MAG: tryptophan 7-halogenase [Steroidobacter sp.]